MEYIRVDFEASKAISVLVRLFIKTKAIPLVIL